MKSLGGVDLEDLKKQGFDKSVLAAIENMTADMKANMAEPGALGLPPLLERRRLEFGIVDAKFKVQAVYDRVLIHQLPPQEFAGGTFGGGTIVAPDKTMDRERREAPRGIVVSAGLRALDELRSNGIDLGHIITFVRAAPWRMRVAYVGAKEENVIILQSGDIVSSEDLRARILAGEVCEKSEDSDGTITHYFDGAGLPTEAYTPADY